MYKSTSTLSVAIAYALWSTAAHADQFTDHVAERYQELGFDYVEIKEGINQLKVEAIKGDRKIEVIYDRETGKILKQENERASAAEMAQRGVDIDSRSENFLDPTNDDESSDDENDESDDDENDDSDEDSDESDDDDEDDNDESDDSDESGDDDENDDES